MAADNPLAHTSFASLSGQDQTKLRSLLNGYHSTQGKSLKQALNLSWIARHRVSLSALVTQYTPIVNTTNPAVFSFLNDAQSQALKEDLLFAFYVLSAQYLLDVSESRRQHLKTYSDNIQRCARLIQALQWAGQPETPAHQLDQESAAQGKHAKYLGLNLGGLLANQVVEFGDATSETIINLMNDANERRLYWVWAGGNGGLLSSVITLMPETFGHKTQALKTLDLPTPALGYVSWIGYYARLAINLGLLLKHTLKGPWMEEAEYYYIPAWERFTTQWQQRKFQILNDAVWATVNLVTFFWLYGSGLLGYWGNVITAWLLLVDASLTIWRFLEESTTHNRQLKQFEDDLKTLKTQFNAETDDAQKVLLQEHINALEKKTRQFKLDWQFKQYKLINDVTYALGIVVAFSLVCCFFFPPTLLAPATALMLSVAGAAACFTLTLLYAAVSGGLDIAKLKTTRQEAQQTTEALLEQFKKSSNEPEKKQYYLEIMRLQSNAVYHQQKIRLQKIDLVRSVFIDAIMPAVIFTSLMFLPTGIGIGVIAAGIALALLSKMLINQFKPRPHEALPEFNEAAYQQFVQNPSLRHLSQHSLFASEKSTPTTYDTYPKHD